jgi:hypothetical protein
MLALNDVVAELIDAIRPAPDGAALALSAGHRRSARVWLSGRQAAAEPSASTWLRDDRMRTWVPGGRGVWFTTDGRHQATLAELRAESDLVEVPSR